LSSSTFCLTRFVGGATGVLLCDSLRLFPTLSTNTEDNAGRGGALARLSFDGSLESWGADVVLEGVPVFIQLLSTSSLLAMSKDWLAAVASSSTSGHDVVIGAMLNVAALPKV
jgi:hypothetical protein